MSINKILCVLVFAALAGCGGNSSTSSSSSGSTTSTTTVSSTTTTTVPVAHGSVSRFASYGIPNQVAALSRPQPSMFQVAVNKLTDMIMSSAIAQDVVAYIWPSSDASTYRVEVKTVGASRYAMYNGTQYFGLSVIANDGSVSELIQAVQSPGSGGGLAIDGSGNVYVGGTNNTPWQGVQAYNSSGTVLWTSVQNVVYPPNTVYDVVTNAIVIDSAGYIYYLSSPSSSANVAGTIFKLAPNGAVVSSLLLNDNIAGPLYTVNGQMSIANDVITISSTNASGVAYVSTYDTNLTPITVMPMSWGANTNINMMQMAKLSPHNIAIMAMNHSGGNLIITDDAGAVILLINDSIIGAQVTQLQAAGPCPNGPADPGFGVTCGPGVQVPVLTAIGQDSRINVDSSGNFYVSAIHQHDDSFYYIDINQYSSAGILLNSYSIKAFDSAPGAIDIAIDSNGKMVIFGKEYSGTTTFLDGSPNGTLNTNANGNYFEVEIVL